jgi:hypothetical protein
MPFYGRIVLSIATTTTAPESESSVLVRVADALFTVCEPQALAGLLSGYRGLTDA